MPRIESSDAFLAIDLNGSLAAARAAWRAEGVSEAEAADLVA